MSGFPRVICFLTGLAFVAPVLADQLTGTRKPPVRKIPASKFLRITQDDKGQPLTLETAIVRYQSASPNDELIVDLVSVVHFGERDYYRKLNKQFEDYDAVLYELVAPRGTRIPKGGRPATENPLLLVQKIATLALDLDLQTEQIDYTRKNLIHADMSPADIAEAVRKRGDDNLTLFLKIAADILGQQNSQPMKKARQRVADADLDLTSLLTDPTAASKVKRMLADQLAALESPDGALGATINTILIKDRNTAAMNVFDKELNKGKKKIAIFYGAGHMPDFERRLCADYGLRLESTRWLTAWDLRLRERGVEELLWRLLGP
jgi:hypothetical protein